MRLDVWTDDRWNGAMRATLTMNPLVINVQPGYFRVRLLWLRRSLDML